MAERYNRKLVSNARTLRKNMTKEERHLWYDFLKDYPVMVNRQKVIGNYIVDFYIAEAKLVIELDGSQHYEQDAIEKDERRTKDLKDRGLTVLRIPNNAIKENFSGVCEHIDRLVQLANKRS